MKLWLLKAKEEMPPWNSGYDKAYGFVVRAETEERAREIAEENSGNEAAKYSAWLKLEFSTCTELLPEGEESLILRDFEMSGL